MGRTRKESEWRNSREAEVELSGTLEVCMRDRDEEMSRQNRKECDQIFTIEARILSVFWERMICLWNWRGDCHFVEEFFNFERGINRNSQRLNRIFEKQTEFIIIWRRTAKDTGFRSEQDHYFTMNRDLFWWSDESNVLTMSSSERTVVCCFSERCPWETIQFRCSCPAVGFIVVCSE